MKEFIKNRYYINMLLGSVFSLILNYIIFSSESMQDVEFYQHTILKPFGGFIIGIVVQFVFNWLQSVIQKHPWDMTEVLYSGLGGQITGIILIFIPTSWIWLLIAGILFILALLLWKSIIKIK